MDNEGGRLVGIYFFLGCYMNYVLATFVYLYVSQNVPTLASFSFIMSLFKQQLHNKEM